MIEENAELVKFFVDHHGIAVLQVNRPQARNALNWAAQERFYEIVNAVSQDSKARVLIITGVGERAFVSGGDLKELINHPERDGGERLNRVMTAALSKLTKLPIPVIAAINGDVLGGGCEIITACDLRIADERARFSFAQIKNGLTTGWGGSARLINLVGQSIALELLLTARLFDAREAKSLGLVHRIIPNDVDVFQAATIWAEELIALPAKALAATKALAYAANDMSPNELRKFAADQFVSLWDTADHIEALTAFKQKRPPRFNQDWPLDEQA